MAQFCLSKLLQSNSVATRYDTKQRNYLLLKQLCVIWKAIWVRSTNIIKVNKRYLYCWMWSGWWWQKSPPGLIHHKINTNKQRYKKHFTIGYREAFAVYSAFANVFLPARPTTKSQMLWLGCKCRWKEKPTTERWWQTVTVSLQANAGCLRMSNTNVIWWIFLCENRQLAREKPCKGTVHAHQAVGTCDYRIKALVGATDDFTHTGFGCSYYYIDFLFLFHFENHFFKLRQKEQHSAYTNPGFSKMGNNSRIYSQMF